MYLYNETLPTPEDNLAFDEALVEAADRQDLNVGLGNEVLRLWELSSPCVVLGRASKWQDEVRWTACQRDGVPVLRRASGGASIVAGPGCLMYSVLISYQNRPSWRALDVAHREVMTRTRDAVQAATDLFQMQLPIEIDGTCDLTTGDRKFSGNALRCKRNWMLYHGTILYSMHLASISDYLNEPARQPQYRKKRGHATFVTNLLQESSTISPTAFRFELERMLAIQWSAEFPWKTYPMSKEVKGEQLNLLQKRYTNSQWHRDR